jgi:signal transduction histidine kinase
VIVGR